MGGESRVGAGVAFELGTDVYSVGEGVLKSVFELASMVEAAHLLGSVAGEFGIKDVEPQRAVALETTDIF